MSVTIVNKQAIQLIILGYFCVIFAAWIFYIIEAPEIRTKKHYDVFITHYKTGFTLDSSNMILLQSAVELDYAKKHFLHSI